MLKPLIRAPHGGLLCDDDVLPALETWSAGQRRVALATLVGIDGSSPRPLGAQMAVSEDGGQTGYLSGGCLEAAIAAEARAAIAEGRNRLLRYGCGSPYVDIRLPCGGGLDIYIDQGLSAGLIEAMTQASAARRPFALKTDLAAGTTVLEHGGGGRSRRRGDEFWRAYTPAPRLVVIGLGPAVSAIARLGSQVGFDVEIVSQDGATVDEACAEGLVVRASLEDLAAVPDPWTAAVVAFHEHDRELDVLPALLRSPCFYIGVLGSSRLRWQRAAQLEALALSKTAIARLRSPCGLLPRTKSRATLAVSVIGEVVAEAQARRYLT
jgi:xanthine dehydrogenase accessory factor